MWQGVEGGIWPVANKKLAFSLITHKELNAAGSHVMLEMNLFLVEPQIRLCETLTQMTQLNCALTAELQTLRLSMCIVLYC